MQDEKRPLVIELAHVLHRRNAIEVRRRRAKSKIGYYETLKRNVLKHAELTASIRHKLTEIANLHAKGLVGAMAIEQDKLRSMHASLKTLELSKMRPLKWMNNKSELNKRILQYRAEYMTARYETARLTCQTRKRVSRITSLLQCNIVYQMGTAFVSRISFKDGSEAVDFEQFEGMYREYDANKAVDKMLRANEEEVE